MNILKKRKSLSDESRLDKKGVTLKDHNKIVAYVRYFTCYQYFVVKI